MLYCPFLKGKQAEFLALRDIASIDLPDFRPIFDVTPVGGGKSESPADESIARFLKYMARYYAEADQVAIDIFDFSPHWRCQNGSHPLHALVDGIVELGIDPTIGVGLDRDPAFVAAFREVLRKHKNARCFVRWLPEDMQVPRLSAMDYSDLSEEAGLSEKVEFHVLDFRGIYGADCSRASNDAMLFLNDGPLVDCQVIVASSAIPHPQNFSRIVPRDSTHQAARSEMVLYELLAKQKIDFDLAYGDYGVVNPEFSEPNMEPELLATIMVPKIFYSSKSEWYFARGSKFSEHPDGHHQYYAMAHDLVSSHYFYDPDFSPGDRYIYTRSKGEGTSGNPPSWLRAEISHHILNVLNS